MDGAAVLAGAAASLAAGLATALGALPILGIGRPTAPQENLLLGFAAGVMLVTSFFSLIAPGIALAEGVGFGPLLASGIVVGTALLGAAALHSLSVNLPDIGAFERSAVNGGSSRSVSLLVAAITLHNIPEGAAVGLGFAGDDIRTGVSTAIGIGVQNLPEGLAVAGALATLGLSRLKCFAGAAASGLVEPVAGTVSAALLSGATWMLPWAFGGAAGAMVYIVIGQIVPEGSIRAHGRYLLQGFFAGFAVMLVLDSALG